MSKTPSLPASGKSPKFLAMNKKWLGPSLAALFLAGSVCASGEPPVNSSQNHKLATKTINKQPVTVFVAYHDRTIIVQVSFEETSGKPPIFYDSVSVHAYDAANKEIGIAPAIPNPLHYGILAANAVGAYKAHLEKDQQLAKITVEKDGLLVTYPVGEEK